MPSPSAARIPMYLSTRTVAMALFVSTFVLLVSGACASNNQGAAPAANAGNANTRARAGAVEANSLLSITEGFGDEVRRDVETLRNATMNFSDVSKAQAVGYPTALPKCIADSSMGGMGRHYFDRAIFDGTLEIARPEMLIYAPDATGKPDKLVAVEYVVPFTILPSTSKAPRLFGQELRRHEDFKYWYLHVWAWKQNKAGLFADWDPSIRC